MKQYRGLTALEAQRSREQYGDNRLAGEKKRSFFRRLLQSFSDPIIRVLLLALVLNILLTIRNINWMECIGILLAVIVSTTVSTLSEMGSENAFEKLSKESGAITARVIRDGEITVLSVDEIVVGDIVTLGVGEAVSADGVILEGELLVNQAALNGESKEVKKFACKEKTERSLDAKNRVFRGSLITRGSAVMRVSEVGQSTFLGGVAKDLSADTRMSPLKLRLAKLASTISKIGYVLAAIVAFSYLFSVFCLDTGFDREGMLGMISDYRVVFTHLIRALTLAVTIVVVAVPEGLPMMICVVLSSNMKRMLRDQILVKKMVGIETAGSLNILFSDKTGTFTSGNQDVKGFVFAGGRYADSFEKAEREVGFTALLDSAMYNTECELVGGRVMGSNASDRAISSYFLKRVKPCGMVYGGIPFDSRYKYSAAVTERGQVVIKGAPEVLMPYVDSWLSSDGAPYDPASLDALFHHYTKDAARLILVALADRLPTAVSFPRLTFVAFAVIRDPLRRSTRSALSMLKGAGIQVVMVTGDSPETAKAIALASGLMESLNDEAIITGDALSRISDEELASRLPKLRVVARALPSDKTRLVRVAQDQDLVVGMTGDGVNDAPALKLADVGFAMGSGTDIAKEAGDIVILDNDMEAMVKAVLYGRTIFKSIRKFIIFQLTMNLCAVGVTLLGPLFGVPSPITVIQMLWVNMIMDTLGGLAFAGEAPEKHTLTEKPKARREALLSRRSLIKVLWNGLVALSICSAFMAFDFFKDALGYESTPLLYESALFSLFIFMGVVMFYVARSERLNFVAGLFQNTTFLLITFLVTVIQLLMVYFGGEVFRTVGLPPKTLCAVACLAFVLLPSDLLRRGFMRRSREE